MHRLRHSRLALCLALFALLAQWLLPVVHQKLRAPQTGDASLNAFCGASTPALEARLLAIAPPPLLKKLRQNQFGQQQASDCPLCIGVHGVALLPAALWPGIGSIAAATPHLALPDTFVVSQRPSRAVQARGPPLVS